MYQWIKELNYDSLSNNNHNNHNNKRGRKARDEGGVGDEQEVPKKKLKFAQSIVQDAIKSNKDNTNSNNSDFHFHFHL